MIGDKRFAVLIDAENIAYKYVKIILDEISNDGEATYKRIYGDWTKSDMSPWKKVLLEHSITPIQQYGYTKGKNASDSAMIIDAMDILYSGNVEGFCLVTSDSDFTRLAARLRESGMVVVGMGEQKTPKAFISSCNKFKYLDILAAHSGAENGAEENASDSRSGRNNRAAADKKSAAAKTETAAKSDKGTAEEKKQETAADKQKRTAEKTKKGRDTAKAESDQEAPLKKDPHTGKYRPEDMGIMMFDEDEFYESGPAEMTSLETIKEAVTTIVAENADEDEWVFIGDLGNRLLKRYPDFDVRNYGYKKLTPFIKSLNLFDVKGEPGGSPNNMLVYVRERDDEQSKE